MEQLLERLRRQCPGRAVVELFFRLLVDGDPGGLVEFLFRFLVDFRAFFGGGFRCLRPRIRTAADLIY